MTRVEQAMALQDLVRKVRVQASAVQGFPSPHLTVAATLLLGVTDVVERDIVSGMDELNQIEPELPLWSLAQAEGANCSQVGDWR